MGFATGRPSLSELEKSVAGAEQTNSISINVSGVPSRGTAIAVRAGLCGVFALPNTSRQASSHPAKSTLPAVSGLQPNSDFSAGIGFGAPIRMPLRLLSSLIGGYRTGDHALIFPTFSRARIIPIRRLPEDSLRLRQITLSPWERAG